MVSPMARFHSSLSMSNIPLRVGIPLTLGISPTNNDIPLQVQGKNFNGVPLFPHSRPLDSVSIHFL